MWPLLRMRIAQMSCFFRPARLQQRSPLVGAVMRRSGIRRGDCEQRQRSGRASRGPGRGGGGEKGAHAFHALRARLGLGRCGLTRALGVAVVGGRWGRLKIRSVRQRRGPGARRGALGPAPLDTMLYLSLAAAVGRAAGSCWGVAWAAGRSESVRPRRRRRMAVPESEARTDGLPQADGGCRSGGELRIQVLLKFAVGHGGRGWQGNMPQTVTPRLRAPRLSWRVGELGTTAEPWARPGARGKGGCGGGTFQRAFQGQGQARALAIHRAKGARAGWARRAGW
jgi:hypothetical protein